MASRALRTIMQHLRGPRYILSLKWGRGFAPIIQPSCIGPLIVTAIKYCLQIEDNSGVAICQRDMNPR
jgi:hypothetical protein